jgi:hypothetical protein
MDTKINNTKNAYRFLTEKRYLRPSEDTWTLYNDNAGYIVVRKAGIYEAAFVYTHVDDNLTFIKEMELGHLSQQLCGPSGTEEGFSYTKGGELYLSLRSGLFKRHLRPIQSKKDDIGSFEHALGLTV